MKLRSLLFLVPLILACSPSDGGQQKSMLAPQPAASFNDPSRIDLEGSVDLIVDPKSTENHWRVKNEVISEGLCSAVEGGVTPGNRRLLRFTVTTPNIGDADNFIGNPREHFAADDGLFELDTCHGHFHFKNYATYKLIAEKPTGNETTPKVWRSAKRGFCMLDTDPYLPSLRDAPRNYWSCGTQTIDGFQGISKGWNDTYLWYLGGQYFVLDGGDGQAPVPAGRYYIEVEVNPAYPPGKKGCPRVTDPATGLCHQFAESDYANNTTRVLVYVAESGPSGPEKNSKDPTEADDIEGKM
jgi:hypothetical protein